MKTNKILSSIIGLSLTLSFTIKTTAQAATETAAATDAKCEKDFNSFEAWREDFRVEATSKGISPDLWRAALPLITLDAGILQKDRSQGGFYSSFLKFSIPRAHPRIDRARSILEKNSELFKNVEATFGVPGAILVSLWGMESSFQMNPAVQKFPIIRSMTTLAYDCRRPAIFRENLLDALLLVQKGEVSLDKMEGQWAGEMSGLQLTPSNYLNFSVDFDKDGHRDIVNSFPDLVASAANMIKSYGWIAQQPYLIEVKVPEKMNWQDADLTLTKMLPVTAWIKAGVTKPDGSPLSPITLNASLMLPMGRLGPSFLAFPNFKTLFQWNASLNNALTVSYLAYRAADRNSVAMRSGNGTPEVLTSENLKVLQTLLIKKGFKLDKVDGFLGTQTRAAVQAAQIQFGLPADSYPTTELIKLLSGV